MDINVSIIDQRVAKLAEELKDEFAERLNIKNEPVKERSTAFVYLVVKTLLDLSTEDALDALTEGGNDFGVDALEVSDVQDGEFTVTLFQGKYDHTKLEGNKNFPENGVTKAIQAVNTLFDPHRAVTVNPMLQAKLEEIRSLIQDGNLPRVRYILCNNGVVWSKEADELIEQAGFPDGVRFEHINHNDIVKLLQSSQPVKDTLRFTGKSIVDDFNYIRVFVGKVAVTEIADLLARHGDRLLERNIRRYLGMLGNRVNEGIKQTLLDPKQRPNFYFYNNGLTLTCSKFDYNALQREDHPVKVDGLQIINGGQTCKTIERALNALSKTSENLDQAFVLVRLYQLPDDGADLIRQITYATNSQNPVDLRDLRSNDERQRTLQASIADLGYQYRRQRSEEAVKPTDITSATAAEAVLSVWRRHPQQAKFMSREHFGKLYDKIFTAWLNGAQVVIATLLFRMAENYRKRPPQDAPEFARYAGAFLAMLMGDALLSDMAIKVSDLNHRNFETARKLVEQRGADYLIQGIERLEKALNLLYGNKKVSLQQLSATFRRGDLFTYLEPGDMF
ncbi:MAG: AIPR family protein [Akkermansiaceae bacterium]|jgi:hypothetical protein|nr:AIPR family protein [Akkermansiaceae bacterium]